LHVALRTPRGTCIFVDGNNIVPQVHAVLDRMTHFCNRIRGGQWTGHTGKRIRNVVNIGAGGFNLGPLVAYEALKHYADPSLTLRFVGNIAASAFVEAVRGLDPAETLVVICSKHFADLETATSARTAKEWLLAMQTGGDEKAISKHLVAISTDPAATSRIGIETANVFELWNWVADQYCIGSAAALSTMLAIGPDNFRAMLEGFHQMDMHFLTTPFERNLPVLMALLSIWYNNFFGAHATAILPYDYYLGLFPAYLQQLIMRSNGKHATLIGTEVTQQTAPVCWGHPGTLGQDSFHQLLHQGTRLIPCDFIAFADPLHAVGRHHEILLANAFAQAEALAFGKTTEEVKAEGTPDWLVPHRVFEGNRPSSVILASRLTPDTFGRLVALYEHSVYTQAVIWNINAFDEWGRELGDSLAQDIIPQLATNEEARLFHDTSTKALIRRCWATKQAG